MLKFELTVAETELILAALGKAPFDQVVGLIGKLREQAQPQLNNVQVTSTSED